MCKKRRFFDTVRERILLPRVTRRSEAPTAKLLVDVQIFYTRPNPLSRGGADLGRFEVSSPDLKLGQSRKKLTRGQIPPLERGQGGVSTHPLSCPTRYSWPFNSMAPAELLAGVSSHPLYQLHSILCKNTAFAANLSARCVPYKHI